MNRRKTHGNAKSPLEGRKRDSPGLAEAMSRQASPRRGVFFKATDYENENENEHKHENELRDYGRISGSANPKSQASNRKQIQKSNHQ